jgi:hypothetical protein
MPLNNIETCDCGHALDKHKGSTCAGCAADRSLDKRCRAGGFTNGELREEMLREVGRESTFVD